MTNSKKSRLMLMTAVMLIGTFLLSPFLGKSNSVTASSVAAAPGPSTIIYLPLVLNRFPIQTVFGAGMDQLTSGGGLDQMVAARFPGRAPLAWYGQASSPLRERTTGASSRVWRANCKMPPAKAFRSS